MFSKNGYATESCFHGRKQDHHYSITKSLKTSLEIMWSFYKRQCQIISKLLSIQSIISVFYFLLIRIMSLAKIMLQATYSSCRVIWVKKSNTKIITDNQEKWRKLQVITLSSKRAELLYIFALYDIIRLNNPVMQ